MSGHSKWHQIKHKKGATDQKRGALFSKLLKSIAVAARENSNPDFNPRLRTAIETARAANVPGENIERALAKTADTDALEPILIEAYGPGGTAMIITGITDSRNRTMSEVRQIMKDFSSSVAEPGSVLWAFDPPVSATTWQPKFPQELSLEDIGKLDELCQALLAHADIESVITNSAGMEHIKNDYARLGD